MKRFILTGVLAAMAATATTGAHAADSSRAEMTGVGSGAAIGGALAGPPGLIIGAAVGAVFGDRWHQKNESIAALGEDVDASRARTALLSAELDDARTRTASLNSELTALDASGARDLHRLLIRGLEIDLPFRTDESQLPDGVGERIAGIAQLLAGTPGIAVQIDGYADPRGSIEHNAALSLQRAESVRQVLTAAGLDAGRIQTFGHGESIVDAGMSTGNPDQFALQRRVTVTFYRDEMPSGGVAALTEINDR